MAMRGVSIPGLVDGRYDSSQHQDAADGVVLGGLFDSHGHAGHVGAPVAAAARPSSVRNGLDAAAQAAARDGQRAREPLHGEVEIDDTWIGGPQAGLRGSRQLKGRRAALVLAAVEKRGEKSGRVRLAVIPDFKATTLTAFIKQHVAPGSTIYTDGLKQFTGLPVAGFRHVARTQPLRGALRQGAASVVPLADRAIGNLQQWLVGTHHGVSRGQLQVYLNEFAFRYNRRRKPTASFQTLLGLGTGRAPTPYRRIRGAQDVAVGG